MHYARELFGRRNESTRLWVVRRADIAVLEDPDLLDPPLDRSFKKPGGYVMRDKLAAARAGRHGEAAARRRPRRTGGARRRDEPRRPAAHRHGGAMRSTRNARALAELLLTMADDEFVSGFTDSEWTGIAPLLEEDVAISSISQDELGHARALYELLAEVLADGRDEDAHRLRPRARRVPPRPPPRPARGDWADTIARRFLYELADEARLASIGPGYRPLADLVEKLRREERYHRMHVVAWLDRLARTAARSRDAASRRRCSRTGLDAPTVFTPLDGEAALLEAGILTRSMAAAEAAWRGRPDHDLVPLGLAAAAGDRAGADGRRGPLGRRSTGCGASSRWSAAPRTASTW